MANDNEITTVPMTADIALGVPLSEKPEVATKPSFVKDVAKGAMNVAKVLWQVPAARGFIATLLVRFGVPGTLLAIGMAVGDKVLGN